MRGNLWQFAVLALVLGLVLPAINLAYDPGTASQTTINVAGLFSPIAAILGLFLLLGASGALLNMWGGGSF